MIRPFNKGIRGPGQGSAGIIFHALDIGTDLIGKLYSSPGILNFIGKMNDKSGPAIAGTIVLNLRFPVGKPVPVSVHIAGDIKKIHDTAGDLFGSGINRRTGRMLSQGPGFRGGNTVDWLSVLSGVVIVTTRVADLI